MAKIAMDPDQVRAMANAATRTAESMQGHMSQIVSSVQGAEWQSQAREEFLVQLTLASKGATQSTDTLRLMAKALDEKANQWEVVGNNFNVPFYHIGRIWDSVMNSLGGAWSRIVDKFVLNKMPSLPGFLMNTATGAAVLGASTSLVNKPKIKRPSWWPFEVGENEEIVKDKLENLEMQREYTYKALEEKRAEYNKYSSKVSEIGQKMRETDVWKPLKNQLKSLGYDVDEKEIKFENMISFVIGLTKKDPKVLVSFVGNLALSEFQAVKLTFQLTQMTNAYQKSQIISTDISNLTNQLTSIDKEIASYGVN